MRKKYSSKVSYGLLAFIFLVFFGSLVPNIILGELNAKMIGLIGLLTLIFAFILHLFFNTQYTIDNKKLKIKCGIFSYDHIDIEKIKEISKTNSIRTSPAPSFDRIEIKYGKYKEIIISPKDKKSFVNDLKKVNSNIKNNITK